MEGRSSSIFMKCISCSENVEQLKILPCLHTFCVKCLETTAKSKFRDGNKVFCSQCKIAFEIPKKDGREEVKQKTFSSTLAEECNSLLCGVCSTKNAERLCIDCNIQFCVSCSSVHEKLPFTKEHSFMSIHSTKKECSGIQYCTSCKKWLNDIEDDNIEKHRFCTVINMFEYEQNLQRHLLEVTTQASENIVIVRKDLNLIDEEEVNTDKLAQLLKKQIEYQSDKLKNYIKMCINNRVNELNDYIDDECGRIEEKLDLSKKRLLETEAEVEVKVNKYENMLQDFNENCIIKAIEEDFTKMLQKEKYDILRMRKKIAATSVSGKLRLSFEPVLLQGNMFTENNIVGVTKRGRKSHPELIKVLEIDSSISGCSIVKSKLYGVNFNVTREGIKEYTFSKMSLESYELLHSFIFKTNDWLFSYVMINKQFCTLPQEHSCKLAIYDLRKQVNSEGWKRDVTLTFSGQKLFTGSGSNLFVQSGQKIVEITLYGDIVKEIQLPSGCQPYSFVCLENDYALIFSGGLHIIDSNGNITKSLDAKFLSLLGNSSNMITDNSSNIFVSNISSRGVLVFDFHLKFIKQFDTKCFIQKLFYDSRNDHLLVFGNELLNVFQL